LLDELANKRFILRYQIDGCRYIQIRTFAKHQRPHIKEQESTLPAPDLHSATTVQEYDKEQESTLPARQELRKGTEKGKGNRKGRGTENGEKNVVEQDARHDHVSIVFDHWKKTMGHEKAVLGEKRKKAILARIKDGYSVETLCQAIDGCRASPFHMGDNKDGTVYDELGLICRDSAQVDKFCKLAEKPSLVGLSAAGRKTVNNLNDWEPAEDMTNEQTG